MENTNPLISLIRFSDDSSVQLVESASLTIIETPAEPAAEAPAAAPVEAETEAPAEEPAEAEEAPAEAPAKAAAETSVVMGTCEGRECTILKTYSLPIDMVKLMADIRLYCPVVARSSRRGYNRVHTDHLGNSYPTVGQMCEKYGLKESVYRSRVNKGWTVEEALTGSRKDRDGEGVEDHLGNHYHSISEMCRTYNIRPDNFCQRRKRGWTLEETLTGKRHTQVQDHLGNTFEDINAMCEHYGVKRSTYSQRIRNGATIEQALSATRHSTGERIGLPTVDHLGNSYPSQRAMCRQYDIKVAAFRARLRNGFSLEEALTAPRGHHRERTAEKVEDPEGNRYPSVKKMCAAHGVNQGTYYSRLNKGMSQAEALAVEPIRHLGRPSVETTDHLGNVFPSVKAMCDHYGVNYCTYRQRLGNGASLEAALTAPRGRKGLTVDHKGVQYGTVKEMCEHYGVSYCTYRSRLRDGMTLEQALTTPAPPEDSLPENNMEPVLSGPCQDHLGNQYADPGEMARAYGLTRDQYVARARFGWDVKSILTTPIRSSGRRKGLEYNGKVYNSRKALCADLGLNYNSFIVRLGSGMTLEQAVEAGLTIPTAANRKVAVKDHNGVQYSSISKMCAAYGISPTVYSYRLAHGLTLEEALTSPLRQRGRKKGSKAAAKVDPNALEGEITIEEAPAEEAPEAEAPAVEAEPAPEETPAEEA